MEPKQILSASLLDIIFDGRNKSYGAYDLRATYPQRIKKALLIVFIVLLLAFSGLSFAHSFKQNDVMRPDIPDVILREIYQEPEKPEPIRESIRQPEQQQVRTERYTIPVVTNDEQVDEPPPAQEDMDKARVGLATIEGIDDTQEATIPLDGDRQIIIQKKEEDDPNEIHRIVQVPASYTDNWAKFLLRNLRAEVPVDNGAPAGRYTVLIQFVVDQNGNISDLKPLTAHGYGMEEEAVRVLKKSKAWNPGIQDGRPVRSFHKQPITFEVVTSE